MRYAMKKIAIMIAILCAMVSISCTSDTVAPEWRIEGPRVLAIAADKPVFSPGDTVDFSLLLAGVDMAARSKATVEWSLGNLLKSLPADRAARFTMPDTADVDIYFGADTDYRYTTAGRATVIAHAVVRLADGTLLPAQKSFLLAKSSVATALNYQAPAIKGIRVEMPDNSSISVEAGDPVFLPEGTTAETINIQAELNEFSAIKAYGYRWFVESSLADTDPVIHDGAISSKVEVELPPLGVLTVHLIVDDRSEEAADAAYAGGLDFVSFTIARGVDSPDEDTLSPDENAVDDLPDGADALLTD